ncbi:hypothetical protein MM221_08995 [Salipaludibacillus sp. LMS25]|uniref:hypothetical protein n=1 Tax=Salipaludibacillus sp. LMS25 TaxID=2924031 RepID=UPI0020D19EFD|nr:hypothetical protein [Salipaludibacillus sp. LMS25]UTR16639.1 hypothetical protein MM221_08995 [Salipaludibacillus sp. LMS25]
MGTFNQVARRYLIKRCVILLKQVRLAQDKEEHSIRMALSMDGQAWHEISFRLTDNT